MIILRYISREILSSTALVSLILVLVVMSGRFIRFLEQAANGELSIELMLTMMLWRIPSSLELIIPLSLTLAVLIAIGRMNQDSELIVLRAAGYSNKHLFTMIGFPALIVAVCVGWMSIFVAPLVATQLDQQANARDKLTVFDTVIPGRFQTSNSGRLIYASGITEDRQVLLDVFIVEPNQTKGVDIYLTGLRARQEFSDGDKFLVIFDGFKYIGSPDRLDWEVSGFERYLIRLAPELIDRPPSLETKSLLTLLASDDAASLAIVSWRVSLPVMCFLMLPFAFSLGTGSPRQSRFLWIIPVILMQFAYVTALSFVQKAIADGQLAPFPGVLTVHLVVLCLGAVMLLAVYRERVR